MSGLRRLPIRLRLTLVFAGAMIVVTAGVSTFIYVRMGSELISATDSALRAQAAALAAGANGSSALLGPGRESFVGSDEEFAQLADDSGRVIESTAAVAGRPLLPPAFLRAVAAPTFTERHVPGVDNVARILATPTRIGGDRFELVLGASLQDRRDALVQLAALLAVAGVGALALATLAAWLLAGGLLGPVERMRREADAISSLEPGRSIAVPEGDDELTRLGRTLNSMLDRIGRSFARERRFLDEASHELRTPLATLKAELDLALLRHRSTDELRSTVAAAAVETDAIVKLAEDLLILSRANGGRLAVHKEETSISAFLDEACGRHSVRASSADVRLRVRAEDTSAAVDRPRLRRAIDNLLDNAIRHTPAGGAVEVSAARQNGTLLVVVEDSGPGFPEGFLEDAFEPFSRAAAAEGPPTEGAGLGLAIVRAIAAGHGGVAVAENRSEGGGRVKLVLPADPQV